MEDINLNTNFKVASNYTTTSSSEPVNLRCQQESNNNSIKLQTIPEYFNEKCENFKHMSAIAYQYDYERNPNKWTYISFRKYAKYVKQCSLILLHLGVEAHSPVAIMAANCPEWFYMELAAIKIGAIALGIYPTSSAEAVHHMLSISKTSFCIVDTLEQWLKIKEVKSRLPNLKGVIQLKEPFDKKDLDKSMEHFYYKWCDLKALHINEDVILELSPRECSVFANECALILFTSGSAGLPKAVLLSHDNIVNNVESFGNAFGNIKTKNLTQISYLPLSHMAAQALNIFLPLELGICTYIADSQAINGSILDLLPIVKPTFFFGTPRIYEKLKIKATKYLNDLHGIPFSLMLKARNCLMNHQLVKIEGRSYSAIKYWCAQKYMTKVKAFLGLNSCQYLYVGGAPTSPDLKRFFLSLDLPLIDAYGLTETSGVAILGHKYTNFQATGQPVKGVELKILEQTEEILLRGRFVFMGYLDEPEKTDQVIDSDGWLHTGDCGYIDNNGSLVINGRLKDMIITSGGENIPTIHIENLIKQELSCLSNVVLIGDGFAYLTALMTFKTEMDVETTLPTDNLQKECITWLNKMGLNFVKISELWQLVDSSEELNYINYCTIISELEKGLQRANERALSRAQKVQYFTVLPQDFSVATGELGSILKLKRHVILHKYASLIDDMYQKGYINKFAPKNSQKEVL